MKVSSRVFQAPVPLGAAGAIEVHVVDWSHRRVALGAHRHADLELVYFETGGGRHVVDVDDYAIGAGDLYLLAPGQVHDLSGMGTGATGWAIEFSPAVLDGASPAGESLDLWRSNPMLRCFLTAGYCDTSVRLRVPRGKRPVWEQRFREMQHEYNNDVRGRPLALSAHLMLLMIDVVRLAETSRDAVRLAEDPVLKQVFTVIEESWSQDLHPNDVARKVRLTPAYLTTLVRRRTGRPLSAWIIERKMTEARMLLLSTDRSVESIAAAVGFPDPAHFNRRFRQMHGAPPGRWRKQNS